MFKSKQTLNISFNWESIRVFCTMHFFRYQKKNTIFSDLVQNTIHIGYSWTWFILTIFIEINTRLHGHIVSRGVLEGFTHNLRSGRLHVHAFQISCAEYFEFYFRYEAFADVCFWIHPTTSCTVASQFELCNRHANCDELCELNSFELIQD